jgi:hypothetical protein
VPGAGFEPATNGLQNRCSTTELTRHFFNIHNGLFAPMLSSILVFATLCATQSPCWRASVRPSEELRQRRTQRPSACSAGHGYRDQVLSRSCYDPIAHLRFSDAHRKPIDGSHEHDEDRETESGGGWDWPREISPILVLGCEVEAANHLPALLRNHRHRVFCQSLEIPRLE